MKIISEKFILISLFIGAIFSILAATISYLITYKEYVHHFQGKKLKGMTRQVAFFTFIFFFIISQLIGIFLVKLIRDKT